MCFKVLDHYNSHTTKPDFLTASALSQHPDYFKLDSKQSIGVNEIRDLAEFVPRQSQYAQKVIQLIMLTLTVAAQNACLKLLDQSHVPIVWFLVTDMPRVLLLPFMLVSRFAFTGAR